MGLFDFAKQDSSSDKNEELEKAQETIKSLRDEMATLERKCQVLEGQNYGFVESGRRYIAQIEVLEKQLSQALGRPVQEQDRTLPSREELESLKEALEAKEAELTRLRGLKDELDDANAQLSDKSWELMEKFSLIKELENQVQDLQADNDKLRSLMPRAQAALKAYKDENTRLKQIIKGLENKN